MKPREILSDLERPICELKTAVEALHVLADDMDKGDTGHLVRFMADHFGYIHGRLRQEFDKAWDTAKLKVVN